MTVRPDRLRFDLWKARLRGARSVLNNVRNKGFEPEVSALPILIPKGGVCVHIGASDGRHSYAMIKHAHASKVFAFEPSSYSYAMLETAIALHGLRAKIEPHRLAIGDREGEVTLTTPRKSGGSMGRAFAFVGGKEAKRSDLIWTGQMQQETVRMTTLDAFWAGANAWPLDFIRADCEGAEIMVLEGAAKTIEAFKPSMLLEIHPVQLETVFRSSAQAIFDRLHRWGYRTFAMMPAWQEHTAPLATAKPWKDYACLHAEKHRDQIAILLSH